MWAADWKEECIRVRMVRTCVMHGMSCMPNFVCDLIQNLRTCDVCDVGFTILDVSFIIYQSMDGEN